MSYRHKETTVEETKTVTTWNRFYKVKFYNPEEGSVSAKFGITTKKDVDGEVTDAESDEYLFPFDPADSFPLLDENGDQVGTTTALELWRAITSYYYHLDS